jgi:hypothetical protein
MMNTSEIYMIMSHIIIIIMIIMIKILMINAYDYGEIFGNRPEPIEGISPGYNVTQNLNAIDNIDSRKFPCFDEINNRCLKGAKDCKYSHDVKDLQREAIKRYQDAEKSKYLPREYRQNTHQNIPTSILKRDPTLRALGTADADCKVSTIKNSTTNDFHMIVITDRIHSHEKIYLKTGTER